MNLEWEDAVSFALFSREKKGRWVFCDKNGEKLKILSLWTRFSRQLSRLGIQNANLHTWQPTSASYLMMRTGNIGAVQKPLGGSRKDIVYYLALSEGV